MIFVAAMPPSNYGLRSESIPMRPMSARIRPENTGDQATSTSNATRRRTSGRDLEAQNDPQPEGFKFFIGVASFLFIWIIVLVTTVGLYYAQHRRFHACEENRFSAAPCVAEFPNTSRAYAGAGRHDNSVVSEVQVTVSGAGFGSGHGRK